jgi:galactokinase
MRVKRSNECYKVVEMRVAATVLASYLNLDLPMDLPTPKHVMDAHFATTPTHTVSTFLIERSRRLGMMLALVEEVFGTKKDGEKWEEVYARLGGISEKDFKEKFHPTFEIEADKLQLYKRIKHAVGPFPFLSSTLSVDRHLLIFEET